MGHRVRRFERKQGLSFFASPLTRYHLEDSVKGNDSAFDLEAQPKKHYNASVSSEATVAESTSSAESSTPEFENMDVALHENPAFQRYSEATTAELFYDLFFVGNLTTFTTALEINDSESLTAYIGFFALLWLTWYQVSLYDVRFSTDSIFERIAKAVHFGVMVGFAVIGPQWHPGQAVDDYKIYKTFGLMLMASRLTLFFQYGVTLLFTKRYKKTILPLSLIIASTALAAILYGALTPTFPEKSFAEDGHELAKKSKVYIAWYVIAICETMFTVTVSCYWRIISFKGTHMVQRMSLLTLIILGEGIIVVCKSISKIVKNEYLWSIPVVAQIIAGKSFPHTLSTLHAMF
jgi:low temperature requirement protein LtrA